MMKNILTLMIFIFFSRTIFAQCDSAYTYYPALPLNVTILSGDTCLSDNDMVVLDSLISINDLAYGSPLELGTQTWCNGRLRFLVSGNYGNSSGVNDTIYSLPDNIGNWDNIASLYLEWNRLSELPGSFSHLSDLMTLYLNNNVLQDIGDSIGNLDNLYFLDLGYNELITIPESICDLEFLNYLWLFNNNLESLPTCFCDMDLDWSGNDNGGYPYFAIGANALCDNIPGCLIDNDHFELSLDQFYYSFPVYAPQNCDNTTNISEKGLFPYQFNVSSPYPNPFNPRTTLNLFVPYDRRIDVRVYDILGNEIDVISNNEIYDMGEHSLIWSAGDHPSGVFFIKFEDGIDVRIRKMIFMK